MLNYDTKMENEIKSEFTWWIIFSSWILATISTLGSLFFSEIMEFPPCVLCWYQRIAMYPLVIIFLVGSFEPPRYVIRFSIPLILSGLLISIYHNLLYYEIIPESASPCVQGVSCSTVFIEWLGFITIPFLSFASFSILLILQIYLYRRLKSEK